MHSTKQTNRFISHTHLSGDHRNKPLATLYHKHSFLWLQTTEIFPSKQLITAFQSQAAFIHLHPPKTKRMADGKYHLFSKPKTTTAKVYFILILRKEGNFEFSFIVYFAQKQILSNSERIFAMRIVYANDFFVRR
ncbi:hypothetical protein CEXT_485711 [Caerostris extrusa]|uniref:Uncharacterized protein n=1 Tax=Caerostris extrusa TaxID=172846 RepID=A0AAV4VZ92_CAEEX|nr:hypothetical protein CEXT_485711 [Caerostris extrusa]